VHRNPIMTRPWMWASGIGLLLYLALQVLPVIVQQIEKPEQLLSRAQAKRIALDIANQQFGLREPPLKIDLTHQSDSVAAGYITRQDLEKRYHEIWDARYPLDVYRADLRFSGRTGTLTLFLHMYTGNLVGWHSDITPPDAQVTGNNREADAQQALQFAAGWGEQADDWIWDGNPTDAQGRWTFRSKSKSIGQSRLLLHVVLPTNAHTNTSPAKPWEGGMVTYEVQVPDDFAEYLDQQNRWAGYMNGYGFILPHLLLLIFAMVYATTCRYYTTPWRGMLLAVLFLAMYTIFYLNLIPGLRADLLEDGLQAGHVEVLFSLAINFVILGIMTLFTYLAAVAGDGLWKTMGFSLWPQWREAGFGNAVWIGMKRGYLLAFLLLGVQSVILSVLASGIGMFGTTDVTSSPANMTFPWLLLLLAWCAGISEEIQSRLFGIGLFRKWLLDAASRITGHEVSKRTGDWLTVLAMLPPGLFWSFGHVSYAVYPVYSRLIELVLISLLLGWFMLKFGFLSVLFAHIIFNSTLMSVQMLFDGLPGDWIAGGVGLFLPACVAYLIVLAHRRRGSGGRAWPQSRL